MQQLKSPSFWLSLFSVLGSTAAGLTHTGDPTLMAIGSAVCVVFHLVNSTKDAFLKALPSIQTVAHDVRDGKVVEAIDKSTALVPIVQEQIVSVQSLIKTLEENIEVLKYRAKGYEVTPSDTTSTTAPGGEHQVIGAPRA